LSPLSDLEPAARPRLLDLVKEAGVDVSDWEHSERGASNPKYCYEWSFQDRNATVLCLWFEHLSDNQGTIQSKPTPLPELLHLSSIQVARARKFHEAVRSRFSDDLPLRAVISTGNIRDLDEANAPSSRVRKRMLDPVSWWVTSHDIKTDQYILTRGSKLGRFLDQFELARLPDRRTTTRQSFARRADVRRRALERSLGKCQWCHEEGFIMEDGRIFLETHHIIPLSEQGLDDDSNVVALCPNHHREAHHGKQRIEMRRALKEILNRRQD